MHLRPLCSYSSFFSFARQPTLMLRFYHIFYASPLALFSPALACVSSCMCILRSFRASRRLAECVALFVPVHCEIVTLVLTANGGSSDSRSLGRALRSAPCNSATIQGFNKSSATHVAPTTGVVTRKQQIDDFPDRAIDDTTSVSDRIRAERHHLHPRVRSYRGRFRADLRGFTTATTTTSRPRKWKKRKRR